MIVTVPVCYPAAIVRTGKRKEEEVLLAAQAHLRFRDAGPGLGVAIEVRQSITQRMREQAYPDLQYTNFGMIQESYLSEGQDSGQLYMPLRFRTKDYQPSPEVDGEFLEFLGANAVRTGRQCGLFTGHRPWEFQSKEALGPLSSRFDAEVVSEGESFRSVRILHEGARDMALAYAARAASGMICDPAGRIHVPTPGPWLSVDTSTARLQLVSSPMVPDRAAGVSGFRLDQFDEAVAYAAACADPGTEPHLAGFGFDLHRPAAHGWDGTACLATHSAERIAAMLSTGLSSGTDRHGIAKGFMRRAEALEARADADFLDPKPGASSVILEDTLALLAEMEFRVPGWPPLPDPTRGSPNWRRPPVAFVAHVREMTETALGAGYKRSGRRP